jgi:hypothetical protein
MTAALIAAMIEGRGCDNDTRRYGLMKEMQTTAQASARAISATSIHRKGGRSHGIQEAGESRQEVHEEEVKF